MRAKAAILALVVLLAGCGAGGAGEAESRPAPTFSPAQLTALALTPSPTADPSRTPQPTYPPTSTSVMPRSEPYPTRPSDATPVAPTATPRPTATVPPPGNEPFATPAGAATCPVTPYAADPPTGSEGDRAIAGIRTAPDWYGGDGLWAFSWVGADPRGTLTLDGAGFHKVLWWREPGVEGRIAVAGRRLDGSAGTLTADFEGNPPPRGQQPGGLSFSAPGCWAITGEAGGKRLTFVALVVPAPLAAQPATPGGAGTPAACDGGTARALLARFLDAFGRGDPAALGTFLTARHADLGVSRPGEEGLLHWYAVDGPAPVYARSRDEALAYFATRHARGEQLRLDAVQDAAYERGGIVGITFALTRQADDLATHRAIGKAAFDCAGGTIVQWAMGPEAPHP